jgi:hypothetical protein
MFQGRGIKISRQYAKVTDNVSNGSTGRSTIGRKLKLRAPKALDDIIVEVPGDSLAFFLLRL